MYKDIKDYIDKNLIFFLLAWFWWIAVYLNTIRLWKKFRLLNFIIYIIVSGWFGMVIQDFIPEIINIKWIWKITIWDMRYSITSISWWLTFIIFDYIETNWIKWLWQIIQSILEKIGLIINIFKWKE